MPENQKEKQKGTLDEDQKDRGYYYDDAHGYEEFDPEAEDEEVEQAFQPVHPDTKDARNEPEE